jgi:putative transposase
MKHIAGRKRHAAEDIVRKLRRADELAGEGKTGEEIAAQLGVFCGDVVQLASHMAGWITTRPRSSRSSEQNARLKQL